MSIESIVNETNNRFDDEQTIRDPDESRVNATTNSVRVVVDCRVLVSISIGASEVNYKDGEYDTVAEYGDNEERYRLALLRIVLVLG